MSLLVQDICGTLPLRARKWSADLYVNERQKIRHYRSMSTEERRRRRKNAKSRFFYFVRRVRKLHYYSDVVHSMDWKAAIEPDSGG